jgi:hypothetical protein
MTAAFHGASKSEGISFPAIPKLTDADLRFVNALHDLHKVYETKVIDRHDYETQRAKLLSDWLKFTVNEAGGNANEVLKIMFGGDLRGVTDTGIKNPSPISVHRKLELETGVASLSKERSQRMTRDLVYELIHGKGQWGNLHGCDEKFSSPRCSKAWEQIRYLVDKYSRVDDPEFHWGRVDEAQDKLSRGTKNLYHHMVEEKHRFIGLKEESSSGYIARPSVLFTALIGGLLAMTAIF